MYWKKEGGKTIGQIVDVPGLPVIPFRCSCTGSRWQPEKYTLHIQHPTAHFVFTIKVLPARRSELKRGFGFLVKAQ